MTNKLLKILIDKIEALEAENKELKSEKERIKRILERNGIILNFEESPYFKHLGRNPKINDTIRAERYAEKYVNNKMAELLEPNLLSKENQYFCEPCGEAKRKIRAIYGLKEGRYNFDKNNFVCEGHKDLFGKDK